jgi:Aromatic-ring hydroxylase, C-terminal
VGAIADLTDAEGTFLELYGLSETGAVLVRPDGRVAWRSRGHARERKVLDRLGLIQAVGFGGCRGPQH